MKIIRILRILLVVVLFDGLFITTCYYGIDKEITRQEEETAYHVNRCESDSSYYPDFCKYLLGE